MTAPGELTVKPQNYELVHHWDSQIALRCLRCYPTGRIPEEFWHYQGSESTGIPLGLFLGMAYMHETRHHSD